MTAEQFYDWIRFDNQCPFGDDRRDMRQAAGLSWQAAAHTPDGESPSLFYPYWETEEELDDRIKKIDAKVAEWLDQSQGSQSTSPPTLPG